jgi:hypothetical protein
MFGMVCWKTSFTVYGIALELHFHIRSSSLDYDCLRDIKTENVGSQFVSLRHAVMYFSDFCGGPLRRPRSGPGRGYISRHFTRVICGSL